MSTKLLSICIPTYNRCDMLDEMLQKLFTDSDFNDHNIEVIVSDNCSTDNTKEIVAKYPLVNYYRNSENNGFFNLTTVLSYATGKYIRLVNDTFCFKPNALGYMLKRIKMHENDDYNLFFYPNFLHNQSTQKKIDSMSSFFYECSYNSTWTAAIGFWKKDFEKVENKNRYASLHFPQLEWMYSIVKNGKETIIYFEDLFDVAIPSKKGGYNVFKTFVKDYLDIVKQEKLSILDYEREKYRLCRHFIFLWLQKLLIEKSDNYTFSTKGVFKIIFEKYWYEPYFYPFLALYWIRKIKG